MDPKFEWDQKKAVANHQKHGVQFQEAQTVFHNPLACIFDDELHSGDEQREIIIGHSVKGRLLLVCFVEKAPSIIRIISARPATKRECRDYEENRF
jgi:uncharacterized DUF497 family protein